MFEAFATIKALLAPYAKHFAIGEDSHDRYSLMEEIDGRQSGFAFVHVVRGGARLLFFPLWAFPELRASVPSALTTRIKSKWMFVFPTITAGERKALATVFAAGWQRVQAQRRLVPGRAKRTAPSRARR